MPFRWIARQSWGSAYAASARRSAITISSAEKRSNTNPFPSPVIGSNSRTVSASPPVARTTGTVP